MFIPRKVVFAVLVVMLVGGLFLFLPRLLPNQYTSSAASANGTAGLDIATFESDTTERTITISPRTRGYIVNGGSVKAFIGSAATVATTDAQAASYIGLPAGASIPWPDWKGTFYHKTASSSTVLYWIPAWGN